MGLLRDGGLSIGLKTSRYVLGMGSAVLLNWVMPIHEYGVYAFVLSVATLLALPGESGMQALAIRELSQARVDGDKPRMRGFVRFANATVLLLSLAIAAATALVVLALQGRISNEIVWPLALALPALMLGSLANTRAGILRAFGSPVLSQVPEQLVRPAALIVMAALIYAALRRPLDATEAMWAFLASSAIAFLVGTALLVATYRRMVGPGPAIHRNRQWLAALLPFSAIFLLQSALTQVSLVLLGFLAPPAEVALFRIAILAADFAIFPAFALSTVVTPDIARLYHRGEKAEVEMLVSRANRLNVASAVAITLALVVLGPWALETAFGPEYRAAWLPMCIVAVSHVAATVVSFVATLANMAGRERMTIWAAVLGLAVNSVLAVLLCARYGALGAAVAAAAATIVWRFAMAWQVWSAIGIRAWAFKWTLDRTDLDKLKHWRGR